MTTKLTIQSLDERTMPAAWPITLSGAGVSWQFDNLGGVDAANVADNSPGLRIVDATLQNSGETDAFDGAGVFRIDGLPLVPTDFGAVSANGYTSEAITFPNLTARVEYLALSNSPTLRTVLTLQNTSANSITVPVSFLNNLGSDDDTRILRTSSADAAFAAEDRWVVSDDADATGFRPAVLHVLAGPGAAASSVSQVVFDNSSTQGVRADYSLTIPAGATRSLLFFQQVRSDATALLNAASFFDGNPATSSEALAGLSAQQLSDIQNWDFRVPTRAEAGGPYEVFEGGQITLNGTGTTDPSRTISNYAWDLDNDGQFETSGQTPTFSAAGLSDGMSRTVRFQVTDSQGGTATTQATIHVRNVAPVIRDLAISAAPEGSLSMLTANISDPGSTGPFDVIIEWGDGTSDTFTTSAGPLSRGHAYATDRVGGYPVSLRIADAGGAFRIERINATPTNTAATLTDLAVTRGTIGTPLTLTGKLADAGSEDVLTVTVEWGDGALETRTLTASSPFEWTHTYAGSPAEGYPIVVTVNDGTTTTTETTTAFISNTPPRLESLSATKAGDRSVLLVGAIRELNRDGQLTLNIDWGNGETASLALPAGATEFTEEFTYPTLGNYTIRASIADATGATDSRTTSISFATPLPPIAPNATWTAIGSQPGESPMIRIFDSTTRQVLRTYLPFEASFTGGVHTATADLNN
ncbi:MAG: PKD domain-containing protein, partial [Fimbriiglobus sp.]